jgi:hypothetical protein
MNLFSRKESAMEEPVVTGVDILRRMVKSWNRNPGGLAAIAREVDGVGLGGLEDFGDGKADLKVEVLKQLTTVLYPHSEYDPELNLLRSANKQEPKPLCAAYPDRFDPKSAPYYAPFNPDEPRFTLRPEKAEPAKPKGRPGWLGGW